MVMKILKIKKLNYYNILCIGLYIYYFCIAVYNPEYASLNCSNYILCLIFVLSLVRMSMRLRVNRNALLIFSLFYLVLIIAVFQSQDIINSLTTFIKLLVSLITCWIVKTIAEHFGIEKVSKIFYRTNLVACFTGIIAFYVFGNTSYIMFFRDQVIPRMTGSFVQPNVFAAFLAITTPFGIYTINSKYKLRGGYHKTVHLVSLLFFIGLNLFCVLQSKSRWSIVSIVIGYLISFTIFNDNLSKKKRVIAGLVIAIIFVFGFIWSLNFDLFKGLFERNSTSIRLNSFLIAFKKASSSIFMGSGLGEGIKSEGTALILDSTILNLLVDTGFIGVLLFSLITIRSFKIILRKSKTYYSMRPYLTMSLVLCVEMIAESILYNSLLNSFIGVMWFCGLRNYSNK